MEWRLWIALLVGDRNACFGVIRGWKVMKGHVDVFPLGLAVFDKHRGYAFSNFAFHLRGAALHPGNLHVGHVVFSLNEPLLATNRAILPG
jgi:hypothetical protein